MLECPDMRILAIETSCDETAISIIEAYGGLKNPRFRVLGNKIASQAAFHAQYGGVFPMMAKREHSKNIVPLFLSVLKEAKVLKINPKATFTTVQENKIKKMLEREPEMLDLFLEKISRLAKPRFDVIAVTVGPGLEPALWVGINFAKTLATIWKIPVIPVNHMEGHFLSVLMQKNGKNLPAGKQVQFPALSLLVSGGHTELVLATDWLKYKKIGQTRDDAAGEAFDKVARMLELPYPGGPEISKLAAQFPKDHPQTIKLPRPMIQSGDFDFSFSGLKTAVLYLLRDMTKINPAVLQNSDTKREIAFEFQNAVVEVLVTKTMRALQKYKAKTLIVGGGVSANKELQKGLRMATQKEKIILHFPIKDLSTDNSLMIGIAGYFQFLKNKKRGKPLTSLKAIGNLSL